MKQEDTKQKILDKALELFSEYGYDSVSVGQIAQAVGIKAPSLYNHFPGKQAIFDAIVESTAARYAEGTDRLSVHVQDARRDVPEFSQITADELFDKLRQVFLYSLHDEPISVITGATYIIASASGSSGRISPAAMRLRNIAA